MISPYMGLKKEDISILPVLIQTLFIKAIYRTVINMWQARTFSAQFYNEAVRLQS